MRSITSSINDDFVNDCLASLIEFPTEISNGFFRYRHTRVLFLIKWQSRTWSRHHSIIYAVVTPQYCLYYGETISWSRADTVTSYITDHADIAIWHRIALLLRSTTWLLIRLQDIGCLIHECNCRHYMISRSQTSAMGDYSAAHGTQRCGAAKFDAVDCVVLVILGCNFLLIANCFASFRRNLLKIL